MAEEKIHIKKLKPAQRKTIRFLGILFFTLLFLQLGFYFGSDLLLRSYLQSEVEKLSEGKYAIDFDRFNLSLFGRGFYIRGFTLTPTNDSIPDNLHQPFYKITIPEISVKKLGYDFEEDLLTVGSLRFRQPGIQSRQDATLLEDQRISPLELLENEIRKSMGEGLRNIIIQDFYIEDADLLLENFISQKSIKAENTHLYVKNIQLNQERENATPFNADGFDLDVQNFEMVLADSAHTIMATTINVSSLERFIKVEKVSIIPDFSQSLSTYYDIDLDNLELTDADINQIFYTADVNVGALILEGPKFSIFKGRKEKSDKESSTGLYPLIENILASISIDDLTIVEGEFLQRNIDDPNKNRIEAEEINFKMDRVYIGPDEARTQDQFFYSQDAALDMSNVRVALADGIHWISGDKVSLSSFEDRISVENVKIVPVIEEGMEPDKTLITIDIPAVSLGSANLKKIYNERVLDISEMMISSPSVLLTDIKSSSNETTKFSLQDLTKDYLNAIYVKRLEMTEGSLVLDNNLRVRQDSLSFGNISFVLENFRLDEQIESDSSARIFLAEDLQLEIEDYALKLSDNLHIFTAKKVFIDTKEELIGIEGFRLKPQNPNDIKNVLRRYSKSTIFDIGVPDFYARGVDINQAFFHEQLYIDEIYVPSPTIQLQIHGGTQEESYEEDENKVERGDILNLLTNYFSVVDVKKLHVEQGSLGLENFVGDKIQTFAENDVSIGIKNFYVDKNIDPLDSRVLFAEELDIQLNNYVFNIAEGKYSIVADGINYNSALEEINTYNVRLRPSQSLVAKAVIQADIPNMSIQGVDLEAFLFENELSLTKLKLSGAEVNLSLNRSMEEKTNSSDTVPRRERNLPKTIEIINIDTVEADDAKFNLAYREGDQDIELINSGINLSFYGFLLDSAKLVEGDIAAFFSNMSLEIGDFSLALRDSIHTINFSKVGLDTQSDLIVIDDFRIKPKNYIGKKGVPVVDARIPQMTLQTSSLTSLQRTGALNIKELLLSQPEIILYLDQEKEAELNGEEKEQISQKVIDHLTIENFAIKDGSLDLKEKGVGKEISSFNNLSINLNDLDFDLSTGSAVNRKFYLNKDFEFELSDYEVKLPDSLNVIKVGLVLLSENNLTLKNMALVPRYGDYQYTGKVGFQTDVAHVTIPEIVFEGINVEKLLGEKSLEARNGTIYNATAEVFRDKRYKMETETEKGMPQEFMMNGGLNIKLDSLILQNTTVIYREFPEKGMIPGELRFTELNAVLYPFTLSKIPDNYPHTSSRLESHALLNGQAPMQLSADLLFKYPYPIDFRAEVGEFELSLLNSIVETNAYASILSGIVRGGEFNFRVDDHEATGKMTLRYNDLKLRLLEERTLARGKGRKKILTFVINHLAVKSNNPRKFLNRLVPSSIYYERNKNRFIFNYLWKSILSGLKGTVGLGQPKAPKKEED